ncbi:RNA polymerase sigma factor [Polaribacter sp. Q13]|uniref:RNA polymerase sigma factor n=1 Tax=Polaribacter sp. Q13 TaxID=2806551 RepID=UPI00193BFFFD|nr:sigma factor [Polaribacter sp. Q13]QVY65004.1 hypothetical protein JOP69_14800 [Polaribacter sp. Q13]
MGNKVNSFHNSIKDIDESSFHELYSYYFKILCVYLLSFTSDKDVIYDVVQDSFLYLWTNRKKIVITTSVKAYLYRMVYNRLMDNYRKNSKRNATLLEYHKTYLDEAIQVDDSLTEERLLKLD